MSQKSRLLNALKRGPVDPMKGLDIGIYRLAARIGELREEGYTIITDKKPVKTRCGAVAVVANYRLIAD